MSHFTTPQFPTLENVDESIIIIASDSTGWMRQNAQKNTQHSLDTEHMQASQADKDLNNYEGRHRPEEQKDSKLMDKKDSLCF